MSHECNKKEQIDMMLELQKETRDDVKLLLKDKWTRDGKTIGISLVVSSIIGLVAMVLK